MKRLIIISVIILFTLAGCERDKQSTDDIITVDVTASYPKKELILQDVMDVEYIPLETNDDFLTQGFVQAVGKNVIIVKNFRHDGDIFIFDRKTGKALKKINRKGQGGEEYIYILRLVLDEDNNEMFVNDYSSRRIFVYDMEGNFKRSLKYKDGTGYDKIYNFDRENLICYDGEITNDGVANMQSFMIISKQDGSITKEIQIPVEEKIITNIIKKDETGMTWGADPPTYYPIIPYFDKWLLVESSADTVYTYSPDHSMMPFIVRTPTIQSTDPVVFLFPSIITHDYYFMRTVKKEYNFGANTGFPSTDLVYDKREKAIFKYTIYNDDYLNKKHIFKWGPWDPLNNEVLTWQKIDAHELVRAYEKDQLKGKLKEIAATLDEESNSVIMLIKHKK
ncbi:MAG: 6-bladed beta-propeller [Tannerella sp.]|jgi:hypothetical protein|nr:6-bladed beta-propeller [Tannerella sp.]